MHEYLRGETTLPDVQTYGELLFRLLPPALGDTAGEEEKWREIDTGASIPRAYRVTTGC